MSSIPLRSRLEPNEGRAPGPAPIAARDATERDWAVRIREGDRAAFEAAFHALCPGLCVYVARHLRSMEAAEDLVQDLFLALWRQREQLNVRETLSTYLYRAARNRALNELRDGRIAARAVERVDLEQSSRVAPDVYDDLLEAELARALRGVIGDLPRRSREVFLLSRQRGMTYGQIAASLGLSVKTVEAHMARALSGLRARLRHILP